MNFKKIIASAAVLLMAVVVSQILANLPVDLVQSTSASHTQVEIAPESSGGQTAQSDTASQSADIQGDIGDYWGNPRTLSDHFQRHGGDFDATDPEDYAYQSHVFYRERENYQIKTDSDGVVRIYDPDTNSFGAYNKDGTARTFFKPSDGQAYFDRQPGN